MTSRPTRATTDGRAYLDLQARVEESETEEILGLVREIAASLADNGLHFDIDGAGAHSIRDQDESSGVRVVLTASLATAQLRVHVDINVGDPVWPAPRLIHLPKLLGGSIALRGYPLPMLFAEKIVTALQRGTVNTRWRDFADVFVLAGRHPIDADDLHRALSEVAGHRCVELAPLYDALPGFAELVQPRWAAWRRKQQLEERLPVEFADVLDRVIAFADPALDNLVPGRQWTPERGWR